MHGQNLKAHQLGREPEAEFEKAWVDLENRDTKQIAGVPPLKFRYDILFRYNEHIKRAKDKIGDGNLKVILYDDFKEDNISVAQSVYDFLGVSRDFRPVVSTVNERSQVRDNGFARAIFWTARQSRRYRFLRYFRGKGFALNRFTQKTLPRPKISAELMQQMRAVYHEDIGELQATLGRELKDWLDTDLTTSTD
jgi:hypothetical protein